jgi:hypothetical protein
MLRDRLASAPAKPGESGSALEKGKKVGNSDCQNIRDKLDPYLDTELLVETTQSAET